MKVDLENIFRHCEDHLFRIKSFSVQERILYYHLLRHSRLEGQEQILIGLLPLANAIGISDSTVRECIRALHERGCIHIVDRSRQGHLIKVLLPEEIEGAIPATIPMAEVKLEELDLFTGRRFITALITRERNKCFYCFKSVRAETCELDHVHSRVNGTDHSYKNIVVACHECNTTKQETAAPDFVRELYRKGVLSQAELADRLQAIEKLADGQLQLNMELILSAI